jgi:hypothetical protein
MEIFGKRATHLLSICLHMHNVQPLMAKKIIKQKIK